jgi:hypothetical protein
MPKDHIAALYSFPWQPQLLPQLPLLTGSFGSEALHFFGPCIEFSLF